MFLRTETTQQTWARIELVVSWPMGPVAQSLPIRLGKDKFMDVPCALQVSRSSKLGKRVKQKREKSILKI